MTVTQYLEQVNKRFKSGISREHSYRTDLEQLISSLVHNVDITNEPANVTDCGNPDYVITKGKIPLGYIEAKDIGKDLNSKSYKEQFTRYKKALDNLIITDYIWFQFFQNGELVFETKIADIIEGVLTPIEANFKGLESHIKDFCTFVGQTIKSSQKLAQMMASKARLFQDILEKATTSDEQTQANSTLQEQYKAFKQVLIHDITPKGFSDLYAQTLAYGMFAARLHDQVLDTFSRQEAAEKIPKSNPFLRKLFQYIAGYDIDERIVPAVNNLADVFRATNVRELLKEFGKSTAQTDPIIHFYETFLAEYDPKLRKARGVWYTPQPVVGFIVRMVDDILKTEFGLKDGLADTSKTKIKVKTQDSRKGSKGDFREVEQEIHKVQILDPATGTGTFLAEVIRFIYNSKFKAMQGVWSSYVKNDLIPRLNGFELLMASYAMAHLKLDLLLQEMGYKATKEQRLRVYLTNSLEEHHPDTGTLFASWLSTEANEANAVKRDTPVMCVIGNPPYAVSSTNKNDWIQHLIMDYKKNLNERKINLDDDYIKFIRYGQHYIEKNGNGVLAYISNNSFIDGITHRQMRKHLLEGFDKVYIINLHGDSKKKETSPDGSSDQNVFDITQGVSINIFIKTSKSKKLAQVCHSDIFGKRQEKYDFLHNNSLNSIHWNILKNKEPYFFFVPKDFSSDVNYSLGFKIDELFLQISSGIETAADNILIQSSKKKIKSILTDLKSLSYEELISKYKFKEKKCIEVSNDAKENSPLIKNVSFRPFDDRFTIYTPSSQGVLWRPRGETLRNMFNENIGLTLGRQTKNQMISHYFISKYITEKKFSEASTQCYCIPLYIYDSINDMFNDENSSDLKRRANLKNEIVQKIADRVGLKFVQEKLDDENTFAPIDIFDFIYAILHSPNYREKYKEFLKIDFPRVPYPKDSKTFWQLVKLGGQIRELHLLESSSLNELGVTYPRSGDNIITRKMTKNNIGYEATTKDTGRVWVNDEQYFDNVPHIAWEFYIGGYQPAQKWLKDRQGRELSFKDISHYQKIIKALTETNRLMMEIDRIDFIDN